MINVENLDQKKATLQKKKKKQKSEKPCAFRTSESVYQELENEQKSLGYKSMSSYLREIVETRKREPSSLELEQYKIFLIGKISNNINQISKVLHQTKLKDGKADFEKTEKLMNIYLHELYELIG